MTRIICKLICKINVCTVKKYELFSSSLIKKYIATKSKIYKKCMYCQKVCTIQLCTNSLIHILIKTDHVYLAGS